MRIAIEARALGRAASGVRTYVDQLTRGLREIAPEHEYALLEIGPAHEALLPVWLNTTVPAWLRQVQPEVVHFTKTALPRYTPYPIVVTIYDVIPLLFPESQKWLPRLLWPATLRHAAEHAQHILTISEASKRDIVEQLQVASEKVTVTPLAIAKSSTYSGVRSPHRRNTTPYILFLGTIEPRKNVPALVRAFARVASDIPHRLVIAGRPYKGMAAVHKAIRQSGVSDRIEVRDFVPKEELHALYAEARLFVWPSIYEGWGFPPQEAMAAGVPVIVSNGGSLPEVAGEAAEVVPFTAHTIADRIHDDAFEIALAERIHQVLTNPAKQAGMHEAGLQHVQTTTWADVARTTLAVYEKVAQEN